jgi:hypothetical protein
MPESYFMRDKIAASDVETEEEGILSRGPGMELFWQVMDSMNASPTTALPQPKQTKTDRSMDYGPFFDKEESFFNDV